MQQLVYTDTAVAAAPSAGERRTGGGGPKGEDLKNRHPPPHIMHSKPHQQHTASCFGFNGSSGFLVGNLTLVGHTLPNNLLWNGILTDTQFRIHKLMRCV